MLSKQLFSSIKTPVSVKIKATFFTLLIGLFIGYQQIAWASTAVANLYFMDNDAMLLNKDLNLPFANTPLAVCQQSDNYYSVKEYNYYTSQQTERIKVDNLQTFANDNGNPKTITLTCSTYYTSSSKLAILGASLWRDWHNTNAYIEIYYSTGYNNIAKTVVSGWLEGDKGGNNPEACVYKLANTSTSCGQRIDALNSQSAVEYSIKDGGFAFSDSQVTNDNVYLTPYRVYVHLDKHAGTHEINITININWIDSPLSKKGSKPSSTALNQGEM